MPEAVVAATIRWGSVVPPVVTSLAIMGSPGPATISLTAAGSTFGVRRSLGYLGGIVVGSTAPGSSRAPPSLPRFAIPAEPGSSTPSSP